MLSLMGTIGSGTWGKTRAITAENPDGKPGRGGRAEEGTGATASRELGKGWKVSPSLVVGPGGAVDIANIEGEGVLRHLWLTTTAALRGMVLRIFWDGEANAAVQAPLGDFFCNGWSEYCHVNSLPVVVAPKKGLNSFWQMPFRQGARVNLENLSSEEAVVYYQLDYSECRVDEEAGYLHASWARDNPVDEGGLHVVLDCGSGPGLYVGTYLAVGVTSPGWWGEGEFKFFLDGDQEFPTICGTGTEDYFGGAWDFDVPGAGYTTYCTPFLGLNEVVRPDGLYGSQQRFGMYRWHLLDPVAFEGSCRVTLQDLGWHADGRYRKRRDDIASTALWYHRLPSCMPARSFSADELEIGSRPR